MVRNYVDPHGTEWQAVWEQGRVRVEVPRNATRAEINRALDVSIAVLFGYRPRRDRARWRVRRRPWRVA